MPVAARFGQRHDEGGWDGFLIGDDLCWSASDLTAAAECEYAVLRQLDYVLKRESRLDIPEDPLMAHIARLGDQQIRLPSCRTSVREVLEQVLVRLAEHVVGDGLDNPFSVIADEPGTERSAVRALRSPAFEHLPRYEAHLSRELDRCLARFRQLQAVRRGRTVAA